MQKRAARTEVPTAPPGSDSVARLHDAGEEFCEFLVGVERPSMGDVLLRTDHNQCATRSLDRRQIENALSFFDVDTKGCFVVQQPMPPLWRADQCGHRRVVKLAVSLPVHRSQVEDSVHVLTGRRVHTHRRFVGLELTQRVDASVCVTGVIRCGCKGAQAPTAIGLAGVPKFDGFGIEQARADHEARRPVLGGSPPQIDDGRQCVPVPAAKKRPCCSKYFWNCFVLWVHTLRLATGTFLKPVAERRSAGGVDPRPGSIRL